MSPSRSRNQHELSDEDYGPSRTQQRREALATLALARQLVEMPPTRLARLELPEDVRQEVAVTRRITANIAHKRQLAYLAKVMRRHGDEAFAAIRAELGENRDRQRQENAAMHRLESLREQLLGDDEQPLSTLIAEHPDLDRQHLRSLIRQARAERAANKPPRAYRELFQLLKEMGTESNSDPASDEAV